jgi:YegS/Rv2252/BmrU family lipid kinase
VTPPGTLVIVNPVAGSGRGERIWQRLEPKVRARLGQLMLQRTAGPGDAESIARANASAGGLTIVVGGDGTVHEVVNGVLTDRNSRRLAVIPAGSGNDFARNLKIPLDPAQAVDRLGQGELRHLDVGHYSLRSPDGTVHSRLFVNSLSVGVSARANRLAARMRRILPGTLRYPLAGLVALLAEAPARYRVTAARETIHHGKALNLTLANGASFGGGLRISPGSLPDDGALDLVLIGPLGRMRALLALARLRSGSHVAMRGIRVLRLRDPIRIARERGPLLIEADGESFRATGELTIELLPARLILCN